MHPEQLLKSPYRITTLLLKSPIKIITFDLACNMCKIINLKYYLIKPHKIIKTLNTDKFQLE